MHLTLFLSNFISYYFWFFSDQVFSCPLLLAFENEFFRFYSINEAEIKQPDFIQVQFSLQMSKIGFLSSQLVIQVFLLSLACIGVKFCSQSSALSSQNVCFISESRFIEKFMLGIFDKVHECQNNIFKDRYIYRYSQLMIKILQIVLLCCLAMGVMGVRKKPYYSYQKCNQLSFIPLPKSIKCHLQNQAPTSIPFPCKMIYHLKVQANEDQTHHIKQLINDQQRKTFRCRAAKIFLNSQFEQKQIEDYLVEIQIIEPSLKSAFTVQQQQYSLEINPKNAKLRSKNYVGFVRALQTFLQSITCNRNFGDCYMTTLPIIIEDKPYFQYRGLLVDSSRHFLPIQILKQTIDAMMYNKLNILHWHIVDQDSFPLQLQSHPELAQYGAFGPYERYSINQVKDLIHYAMVRGVRIIPEIDTPGHAAVWAKAPQNQGIACTFTNKTYRGPLDITLDKTYQIVKQVFKEIFQLFPDPFVHLGGDQVQLKCLANKTEFLRLQAIPEKQLEMQYRRKQRKILKQLNSTKRFLYWMTDKINYVQPDDIVHWWGKKALIPSIEDRSMVISKFTPEFYIDMGAGNIKGNQYYEYSPWLNMFNLNFGDYVQKVKKRNLVMGGQLTLWSQVSNIYTHHTKIWIRSSAMADRLWSIQQVEAKPDFFRRITAHERLMNRRGIPTSPATCQQCESNPEFC